MYMLAADLEDIESENIDESLVERQICQYFPLSINCAIQYYYYYYLYTQLSQPV